MVYNLNYFLIIAEAIIIQVSENLFNKKYIGVNNDSASISNGRIHITNSEKFFMFLSFVQLSLVICLRDYSVGTDTQGYCLIYQNVISGGGDWGIEIGSVLLMKLAGAINRSNTTLLSVFALPTMFLFYRFIYKHSENVYLSVVIFSGLMFYFQMFNIIRQSLAMAIAIQSVSYVQDKKWIKALLIIVAASMFHASAWAFLIIFFINKIHIKFDIKYFAVILLVNFLLLIVGDRLVWLITDLVADRYQAYLYSSAYSAEGNILNPIFYLLILLAFCLISENKNYLFVNMLSVSTFLFTISINFMIVNRMPYYFTSSLMVLLPYMVKSINNRRIAFIAEIVIYIIISIYEVLLVARGAHGIMPYKSIL